MSLPAALILGSIALLMTAFAVKVTKDTNAGCRRIKKMMQELGYDHPIE